MIFAIFITFIILLRLGELYLSRRNERWLRRNGAVEYGKAHYSYMVALHVLFIISMIIEYRLRGSDQDFSTVWLFLYLILLFFKVWVIYSLGNFWSTKIFRVKQFPLVKSGPYKYVKHPNYLIVIGEIIAIPLVFHLYYTAFIFTILNGVMLFIRIREENKVLRL